MEGYNQVATDSATSIQIAALEQEPGAFGQDSLHVLAGQMAVVGHSSCRDQAAAGVIAEQHLVADDSIIPEGAKPAYDVLDDIFGAVPLSAHRLKHADDFRQIDRVVDRGREQSVGDDQAAPFG